jgi:hypothetical protein
MTQAIARFGKDTRLPGYSTLDQILASTATSSASTLDQQRHLRGRSQFQRLAERRLIGSLLQRARAVAADLEIKLNRT